MATACANKSKVWVETYPNNGLVTDWYIRSIGDVFARLGFDVEYTDDCTKVGDFRSDLYFVSVVKTATILFARGCKRLVYWAQGIAPEEDYLRLGSKPRKVAFDICERLTLKRADRVFMVSDAMRRHFESKYGLDLAGKTFVAPCCNETMHPETFREPGKYDHPVFSYAGGLSKYQCIDEMLELFADIQGKIPDAELLFYTWDVEKARELVASHCIENVVVESKKQDELPGALARAKYGLVIRDDIAVNRVATPTKISTYMANGVIPVVTSCVESFADASQGLEHVVCCEASRIAEAVAGMERMRVDAGDVLGEYRAFFDEYFDLGGKAQAIEEFLAPLAKEVPSQ